MEIYELSNKWEWGNIWPLGTAMLTLLWVGGTWGGKIACEDRQNVADNILFHGDVRDLSRLPYSNFRASFWKGDEDAFRMASADLDISPTVKACISCSNLP